MKRMIFCLALLMAMAQAEAFSQIATVTDNEKALDVQLVSLKGDKRTGEIRPVLKFRGRNDWTEVEIHQPMAWNADGEVLYAPENDVDVNETAKISNGLWTKFNVGRWFRLVDPTRSVTSLSVLRIPYAAPGWQYDYGVYNIDFIDVPVEWEEPEVAPTTVARRIGAEPFTGVSYYLWNDRASYSYYKEHYLNGEVRLECVSREANSGIATVTLQLKVDNPKVDNGQAKVYIGSIIYIDDKGTYAGMNIKQFYPVRRGEWTEIEIKTPKALFFQEATQCKWLQICVKDDEGGRNHYLVAYDVPIFIPGQKLATPPPSSGAAPSGKSAATASTPAVKVTMNQHGVGPLQLSQQMPTAAPQGSFYTSAKKRADEYSLSYELYKASTKIGEVSMENGTIYQIMIEKPCDVQLDNGITIGTSLREAAGKPGVQVSVEYYYDLGTWDILYQYNGVSFGTSDDNAGLTPQAVKKLKDGFQNGNPVFDIKPSDINPASKVGWLAVSASL